MFKRQYFIYAEVKVSESTKIESWRQFYYTSLFPRPKLAIEWQLQEMADYFNVSDCNISVKAFNKC